MYNVRINEDGIVVEFSSQQCVNSSQFCPGDGFAHYCPHDSFNTQLGSQLHDFACIEGKVKVRQGKVTIM